MYSCVKVITPPGTGASTFTETFTGINDAATGVPFVVRTMFVLGGNAFKDSLSYWGMASSNSAGDSAWHYDTGFYHDSLQGDNGQGECNDFSIKCMSGANGYGFGFMDTWPDIFFGGYIGGFGYINNVVAGGFDVTWSRRDRAGDSRVLLCFGGSEYDIHTLAGASNGTVGPPVNPLPGIPQGIVQLAVALSSPGAGPAVTGAGGGTLTMGWDTRDGNRGTMETNCGNQNGNSSIWYSDRMCSPGAHVTRWGTTDYDIAGGNGGGGTQIVWCGTDLVCKAGRFAAPATNSSVTFNMGLKAKGVIFQTAGTSADSVYDTSRSSGCIGYVDPALSQASFWTGETAVGVTVSPLLGGRYISSHDVIRTSSANGAATTFQNIGTVSYMDTTGEITIDFTNTDGTTPEIIWFAVGLVADELGTIEVDKVWDTLTPGQVTLRIGTTPGDDDIASQLTGLDGGPPLVLGPETVHAGTYYVSETHSNLWQVSLGLTVNGIDTPIGPDGQVTVANGDELIVTITNRSIPPPSRPKQWKLYKFNMKLRKEERA